MILIFSQTPCSLNIITTKIKRNKKEKACTLPGTGYRHTNADNFECDLSVKNVINFNIDINNQWPSSVNYFLCEC